MTTDATPPLPPSPTVWPALRARDGDRLIGFLVEAFGFTLTARYGDADHVAHAELAWPLGGGVMLGEVPERSDDPWPQPPGTSGTYVVTDEVDALHARAVAAGATSVLPPHDTDHGSRECVLRDPEGNSWGFGTYRGAPVAG